MSSARQETGVAMSVPQHGRRVVRRVDETTPGAVGRAFRSLRAMSRQESAKLAVSNQPRRLAAVASSGGHLVQLRRLQPLLTTYDTRFFIATGNGGPSKDNGTVVIPDFSRSNPWLAPKVVGQLVLAFMRLRPEVVLTTGAAPGLMAVLIGRLLGARTIWLDSIANAERLSGSGRAAKYLAHHCLTQWPKVAEREKVAWIGSVL